MVIGRFCLFEKGGMTLLLERVKIENDKFKIENDKINLVQQCKKMAFPRWMNNSAQQPLIKKMKTFTASRHLNFNLKHKPNISQKVKSSGEILVEIEGAQLA